MAPQHDRKYMVTDAMLLVRDWHRRQAPIYKVEETAKFFFGMSASWLRLKLTPDKKHPDTWFVFDGKRMDFRRLTAKSDSARVFWISDIERMAYSLYDFGAIEGPRLAQILEIVKAEAFLYGLFDDAADEATAEPVTAGA